MSKSKVTKSKVNKSKSTESEQIDYYADRIRVIREDISLRAKQSGDKKKWTQARLNEAIGLHEGEIERIENKRSFGGSAGFLKVIQYLDKQGYNIRWILIEDNSNIPMYKVEELNLEDQIDKIKKTLISEVSTSLDQILIKMRGDFKK